jgi:hypothetical protein
MKTHTNKLVRGVRGIQVWAMQMSGQVRKRQIQIKRSQNKTRFQTGQDKLLQLRTGQEVLYTYNFNLSELKLNCY